MLSAAEVVVCCRLMTRRIQSIFCKTKRPTSNRSSAWMPDRTKMTTASIPWQSLITIMMSNNFVEVKGAVFKKECLPSRLKMVVVVVTAPHQSPSSVVDATSILMDDDARRHC